MSLTNEDLTKEINQQVEEVQTGVIETNGNDKRGFLDRAIEKLTSRKLLVWGFATGLLMNSSLTGEEWLMISLAYVGSQAAVDFVVALKKAK